MRVNTNGWRKYLLLALLVPVLSSCSAARPEGGKDMVVLEWPDGKPIAGAIVIALWRGQEYAIVETNDVCDHVETTVTAADGSFQIPTYSDLHPGISKKWLDVRVYKAGYVESLDRKTGFFRGSLKDGRFYLEKDSSPRTKRVTYLNRFDSGTDCPGGGESRRNLYVKYKSIASELASLAVTQREKDLANYYDRMAEDARKGKFR